MMSISPSFTPSPPSYRVAAAIPRRVDPSIPLAQLWFTLVRRCELHNLAFDADMAGYAIALRCVCMEVGDQRYIKWLFDRECLCVSACLQIPEQLFMTRRVFPTTPRHRILALRDKRVETTAQRSARFSSRTSLFFSGPRDMNW